MTKNSRTTEDRVVSLIAHELKISKEEITKDANLKTDCGMDSLDEVCIIIALEKHFGINIPDDSYGGLTKVDEFINLIQL